MGQREEARNRLVGSAPVNARTRAGRPSAAPPVPARARAALRRAQLGDELSRSLPSPRNPGTPLGVERHLPDVVTIAGTLLTAGGAAGCLLFLDLNLWRLAGIAVLSSAAGLGLWQRDRRLRPRADALPSSPGPLLDPAALSKLDVVLQAATRELPAELCEQLVAVKAMLGNIVTRWGQAPSNEHFTVEDRVYVARCIESYLPDLLIRVLQVPAAQRADTPLGSGASALDVLRIELDALRADLQHRHEKLVRSLGEALLEQQRFLASRRASR